MYSNKFNIAVKSNGKVLREFKDTVMIPFGSEYSIYLKNLNSVRAEVNITIDGQDVCPEGLVVNANSEINIERFIKDLTKGNRFKFIERTGNIEQHRGIKAEDGLIRVAFKFEKVPTPLTYGYTPVWGGHWEWKPYSPTWIGPYFGAYGNAATTVNAVGSVTTASTGIMRGVTQASLTSSGSTPVSANSFTVNQNDVGITVPGSISDQKFQSVSGFATEAEEHVIILRLIGETEEGKAILKPVTVKSKPKCVTCGKVNKATAKFCSECATALTVV